MFSRPLLILSLIAFARYQTWQAIKKDKHQQYLSARHYGMSQEFKILKIILFSDNLEDNPQKL